MKAILAFDLNDPDDKQNHKIAANSLETASKIEMLREDLRRWRKHGHLFQNTDEVLDKIWNRVDDIYESITP